MKKYPDLLFLSQRLTMKCLKTRNLFIALQRKKSAETPLAYVAVVKNTRTVVEDKQ